MTEPDFQDLRQSMLAEIAAKSIFANSSLKSWLRRRGNDWPGSVMPASRSESGMAAPGGRSTRRSTR